MPEKKMTAEELLDMAKDADKQAARSTDENQKARWREIAKGYRDLTEVSEKLRNPKSN